MSDGADLARRAADELVVAGFPRLPAQVLMALTVEPAGRLAAAEIAERLAVSPAAVSGAVKYLGVIGMIRVGSVPGTRRHVYSLPPTPWYASTLIEDRTAVLRTVLEDGVDEVPEGPGRERIEEMIAFFRFLREELPPLWERWRASRSDRPLG